MDETTNDTPESANTAVELTNDAPARAPRANQDQRFANEITEASVLIQTLEANPSLAAQIGKTGLSNQKRIEGKALHAAAQGDYNARQSAMGSRDSALAAADSQDAKVEKDYADFRVVMRQAISDPATRTALGLDGKIFQDRQKRLTQLRASYAEAKKPARRAALDAEGYDLATLNALLADADLLDTLTATARQEIAAAQAATEARNASVKALRMWTTGVKTRARRSLAAYPELLRQLGA